MANTDHQPPELFKYGGREYLVYEVADHAEHPPRSIGVRLQRHRASKYSVFCTGSYTYGELKHVHFTPPEEAESDEAREMIRLFEGSPELQDFVIAWIEYCYQRRETHAEG